MTENDAKAKWCPMVRAGNEAGCNRNTPDDNRSYTRCIASDCMMWRWSPHGDEPNGYCGLAGKQ